MHKRIRRDAGSIPAAAQLLLLRESLPVSLFSPRWEGLAPQAYPAAGSPENRGQPGLAILQDRVDVLLTKHTKERATVPLRRKPIRRFNRAATDKTSET